MEKTERAVPEITKTPELPVPDQTLLDKYEALKEELRGMERPAVGFSGGVDSTFLLYAAHQAGIPVIAVTACAAFFPVRETKEAEEFCRKIGVKQYIVRIDETEIPGFRENPKDRCYFCKKALFTKLGALALEKGMKEICEASNLDDNGDYRPGLEAVKELGIKSPLRTIGFSKQEIRVMSKHLGLPTFGKPSFACLASRFPYGEEITLEKLDMTERAEQLLMDLGFHQFRVRMHGKLARIELLPEEFPYFMAENVRKTVYDRFREIGFSYTALDIRGYRSGSMNETLTYEELKKGLH